MAALKFFGKKESKGKKEPKKEDAGKGKKEVKKAEGEAKIEETVSGKKHTGGMKGDAHLVKARITEKATDLAQKNQYVFVVQTASTKKDIEISVEKAYGVTVEGVRIVNVHPKKMRLGRIKGVKKGYKKAIVKVKAGQTIEILPT
jgi:large subunit ribosomal protein L23